MLEREASGHVRGRETLPVRIKRPVFARLAGLKRMLRTKNRTQEKKRSKTNVDRVKMKTAQQAKELYMWVKSKRHLVSTNAE